MAWQEEYSFCFYFVSTDHCGLLSKQKAKYTTGQSPGKKIMAGSFDHRGLFLVMTGFSTSLYGNYLASPVLFTIPLGALVCLFLVRVFIKKQAWRKAWLASGGVILGITFLGIAGLYPNLLPSTLNKDYSLTIFNSASSHLTLKIMLGVALIFVPLIIAYQAWAYNFFKGKVQEKILLYD
jgi:cytochrome d ubiquinol oxidase subunit II